MSIHEAAPPQVTTLASGLAATSTREPCTFTRGYSLFS